MTPNPSVEQELLNCPFCGSDETSRGYTRGGGQEFGNCECHNCNACVWAATEAEAIAAWNHRQSPPQQSEYLAGARESLDQYQQRDEDGIIVGVSREALEAILADYDSIRSNSPGESALREALQAMVEEQCDYMRLNNLGDPEQQHNIKRARAALGGHPNG